MLGFWVDAREDAVIRHAGEQVEAHDGGRGGNRHGLGAVYHTGRRRRQRGEKLAGGFIRDGQAVFLGVVAGAAESRRRLTGGINIGAQCVICGSSHE